MPTYQQTRDIRFGKRAFSYKDDVWKFQYLDARDNRPIYRNTKCPILLDHQYIQLLQDKDFVVC